MNTSLKRAWDSLISTARIDPDEYSMRVSPNRWRSFGYALAGWLYMLRYQKNTRIMSVISVLVLVLGLWLKISLTEWALLVVTTSTVWTAEFLNAGIEAAVNLVTQEFHPMAKVAKDVAAAAVLVSALAAALVGVLIFAPPLLAKLGLGA